MEDGIAGEVLKRFAPVAVIVLVAVIYLDRSLGGQIDGLRSDMNQGFTAVREEISGLRERMTRIETIVEKELNYSVR